MVAEAKLWGDVEGTVRSWARDTMIEVDGRVFFGANNQAPFPQIVLFRVSGPDDEVLIQFDVWAANKAQAASLAAALATAVDGVHGYTAGGVVLKAALVEGVTWQPDDESNRERYVVQATFSAWALP